MATRRYVRLHNHRGQTMLGILALLACPKTTPPPVVAPEPVPAATAPVPRLLVLVVVDQLPIRLLQMPSALYEGGLATLTGEEAFVSTARYAHAITYTCPGHATISTGAAPSVSGIISNDWYLDPVPGTAPIYCGDASFLRVETLADRVMQAGGQAAAVALKDRAALMLGGPRAQLVSWYDRGEGRFTGPLSHLDLSAWMSQPWEALHPETYAQLVGPDDGPLEADPGLGTTFPHPAPDASTFLKTPFAGSALVDAALAAIELAELGTDPIPDLLALSFSQTDYIGHSYTSESWEALDGMVRLDADLDRLIAGIEERIGGDFTVLLTSDHGSFPADKLRIGTDEVPDAANRALAEAGIEGQVVFESPSIYLPAPLREDPALRAPAATAIAEAVAALPGIAGAWAWRDVPPEGEHAEAVLQSVDEERSGEVYVMRSADALYDYPGSEGKGTSHGTAFPDDTDVPFLAWGTGVAAGASDQLLDVRQVAPTAARLMGLEPPAGSQGEPAAQALETP